jgi:ribonuclease HII
MFIAGIDEAGRGPIIGPMVLAGVIIDEHDEHKLKEIGVKDSKLLSPSEREGMFEAIKSIAKEFTILIVLPQEIDDAVFGKGGLNLNHLEAKKTAEILNTLKPDIAYIDCPSNNTVAYNRLLSSQLTFKPKKLITEHKADVNYVVAAAASILAKVTRDREVEHIKKEIAIDFGSGYLSDPKTAQFLQNHYETHATLFRKSWLPYQNMANKKFQRSLEDFTQSLVKGEKKSYTLDDLKCLESHGFHFQVPKSEHERAIMKGPCTVILYKNGKLLIQGSPETEQSVRKVLNL